MPSNNNDSNDNDNNNNNNNSTHSQEDSVLEGAQNKPGLNALAETVL